MKKSIEQKRSLAKKKTISQETASRLSTTPWGEALRQLVLTAGNPTELASKLGVDPQSVRNWIYMGAIPKVWAIKAAEVFGGSPQDLRPDLAPDAWVIKEVKPKPARQPVARSDDARLLLTLAEKYGSVKALCAAAFCTPGDFHTWKTRGRIPAIKLPTFLALQR